MFEQNVCHSLSVNSHNQNELIQGKFGNLFFSFVKKGTLMSSLFQFCFYLCSAWFLVKLFCFLSTKTFQIYFIFRNVLNVIKFLDKLPAIYIVRADDNSKTILIQNKVYKYLLLDAKSFSFVDWKLLQVFFHINFQIKFVNIHTTQVDRYTST